MSSDRSGGVGGRGNGRVGLLGWLAGTDTTDRLDERERYILMEAFAVGFSVLMHLCFALAAASIWIWGEAVYWMTLLLLAVPTVAILAVVRWSAVRGGVSPYSSRILSRRDQAVRSLPAVALVMIWLAGSLRRPSMELSLGTLLGGIVGGLIGLAAVLLAIGLSRWFGARKRQAEQGPWVDDDEFD